MNLPAAGSDYTFDVGRIVVGELPGIFYIEIVVRAAFMYLFALFLIRLTGKRSLGQLSPFDFVIIIALGSAVGDPMFYDDVPIGHAVTVICVVIALTMIISRLSQRHPRVERITDSSPNILVLDGAIDHDMLAKEHISLSELRERLRLRDVTSIDMVRCAVLEPSGQISVLTTDDIVHPDNLWSEFLDPPTGAEAPSALPGSATQP